MREVATRNFYVRFLHAVSSEGTYSVWPTVFGPYQRRKEAKKAAKLYRPADGAWFPEVYFQ